MSIYTEPSTFWQDAHPHLQETAPQPMTDAEKAAEALMAHILLKENCREKRESLPALPPCDPQPEAPISILTRVAKTLHLH